jgi:hypothetical protein
MLKQVNRDTKQVNRDTKQVNRDTKQVNRDTKQDEEKKCNCSFCNFRTTKLTKINSNSYCIICRLTLKPTTYDTHKIIAAYSIHQQVMINKLYREYILKNNKIPEPHDIDPNCRIILINPTVLHEMIELMTPDERSCFLNIKYFLTNKVDINEIKTVNFFNMINNKGLMNNSRVNGEINSQTNSQTNKILLLKHQKNLYDKYYYKFTENNLMKIQNLFKS